MWPTPVPVEQDTRGVTHDGDQYPGIAGTVEPASWSGQAEVGTVDRRRSPDSRRECRSTGWPNPATDRQRPRGDREIPDGIDLAWCLLDLAGHRGRQRARTTGG